MCLFEPEQEKSGKGKNHMKKNHQIAKTIGIGLAVGGAAMLGSAALQRSHKGHRSSKRTVNQVVRTVGNVVDSVQSMMH